MTSTAISGYFPSELGRRPTADDPVFPVLPFAGVLAVAQEQDWHAERLFPSFFGNANPQSPPYCSYSEARQGLQLALRRHRGLELALLSGARKSIPHLGVMGLGLMSQPCLGDALEFGLRYQLVAGSMLELRLEREGAEAFISALPLFDDPETQPFLDIDHLATTLNTLRQLPLRSASSALLRRVELSFDAPTLGSGLAALFGVPVVFGCERSRIVFDAAALAAPLSFHNRASVEISRQACERELAGLMLTGQLAPTAVSTLMRSLYDAQGRLLPLPTAAEKLDLSLRSLHRALAREGIRYSALLEQQQRKRAEEMLMRGAATSDVAESLAFSDQRSFVRAFERWTGESPAAWRRRQSEAATTTTTTITT